MQRDRRHPIEDDAVYDEPPCFGGDDYYHRVFIRMPVPPRTHKLDVRDRAAMILQKIEPLWDIDDLRKPFGNRYATRVRNQVIAGLLQEQYRVKRVAAFFRISESTVAAISSAIRYAALEPAK